MTGLPFTIRPIRPTDVAFVTESWMRSASQTVIGRDSGPGYIREMKRTIRDILARPTVTPVVACDLEDKDAIYGYCVADLEAPPVVYYLYVKAEARRFGIARGLLGGLLAGQRVEYTHRPSVPFRLPIPESWTYNHVRNYR
jgi:hypothetical protein